MSCEGDQSLAVKFPIFENRLAVKQSQIYLRADVHYGQLIFKYSLDGQQWQTLSELDYRFISDEAGKGEGANFTGAFVGVCAQDMTGSNINAEFSYFDYNERHD